MGKRQDNNRSKFMVASAVASRDIRDSIHDNPLRDFMEHVGTLFRCQTREEADEVLKRIPEDLRARVIQEARWAREKAKYYKLWRMKRDKLRAQKPFYRSSGARKGGKKQGDLSREDHPQQGLF